MCPHCRIDRRCIVKKGFYRRKNTSKKIPRFYCHACRRTFSAQTSSITYYERKGRVRPLLFQALCSGVSQRRCAEIFKIHRTTVARKIVRWGVACELENYKKRRRRKAREEVVFDEVETFEHTKCKPLSIALAVERHTRRVLSARVASMPAKGHLAAISRKKYGQRKDERPKTLREMMGDIQDSNKSVAVFLSDQCPRYPHVVKKYFPKARHYTFKGRRGCVTGQGELKEGGFDPLFSLNHSAAMVRDNLKRMSRRTWCTTKRRDRLQALVHIYVCFHNYRLSRKQRLPEVAPWTRK